ncbi:LLM class flavin-dependent oxidoreductase [Cellulomonas edaphi]|uniref:LLM class flavin-dependent oxidoreductase n=1 Tax=Cellulomonas edaphi TaxID=3053468 RepID=A0ABT7S7R4_9CELL|nr:LLM class flavin-dependent oxidoreductase [Cellulomons edaphi]MDM7831659.1 LLM class flavin-dependent oxidoreductase [Cellulomons edaphi]
MPVEFLGAGYGNPSTETVPLTGPVFDPGYTREIVRAHEQHGWDHVLFPYASDGPDPAQAAAWAAAGSERIALRVAHRPNVSAPTFAAKTFATLHETSGGRVTAHLIAGGVAADQRAEGDDLDKDARYDRLEEYARLLLRAWTEERPFSHAGRYYRVDDFVLRARASGHRPGLSAGGASRRALEVGAAVADVFALFGEPLAATAAQVDLLRGLAAALGRPTPRLQIAFRPIVAATDDEAWAKAHAIKARIDERAAAAGPVASLASAPAVPGRLPENTANLRLAELAAAGERHDRALWTPTVAGAGGLPTSATALVGSYRTVADALLDYVDLGFEIFGLRGYDLLEDAVEFGDHVTPLVRAGVAARAAHDSGRAAQPGGARTTLAG